MGSSPPNVSNPIALQETKGQCRSGGCLLYLSGEAGSRNSAKARASSQAESKLPSASAEGILPSFRAPITLSRQSLYLYEFVLKTPQTIHPGTSPTASA